jgi:hypothetical protein
VFTISDFLARMVMQPRNTLVLLVVALLMGAVSVASAQGPAPAPPGSQPTSSLMTVVAEAIAESAKEQGRSTKRQAQRDPLVRSGLTLPEPQLTFETTRGNGRATGTIGFVQQQAAGESSFLLAMSAPIGNSPDAESRPIDLRGLTNGAALTVGFNSARMFKTFSVSDITKLCAGIPKEDCTAGKLQEKHPELSRQLLNTVFQSVPLLYGATFTFGRNKFSFFDSTGTRQAPVVLNDVEIEGTVGVLVNKRTNLLAFHVAYADTHAASPDRTQLCRPLAGSVVTRCDAAVIGAPIEEQSVISTIEYRWQLPGERKFPVAFAPKFQFALGMDDAEDLKSFEVPVYFFQEKADPKATSTAPKLNGGVSAGWRSDDGFQVYVFIGTTFRLFALD